MRSLKIKSLLCVAMLLCGATVIAQPGGGRPPKQGDKMSSMSPIEMAEKRTNMMAGELGLSEAQKKEILALNVQIATSMQEEMEVRRLEQIARENERKEMMKKREEYSRQMMALLNDEQKVEYAMILSKMGDKGGAKSSGPTMRGGRNGGAPQPQGAPNAAPKRQKRSKAEDKTECPAE